MESSLMCEREGWKMCAITCKDDLDVADKLPMHYSPKPPFFSFLIKISFSN